MSSPTPRALVVQIAREQGGIPVYEAVCPWCWCEGATDPHHWAFKRSDNVPDEVLHTPQNVVLLHHNCHSNHGQTKAMTERCLQYKQSLGYDIFAWVDDLIERGVVKHRPDIYGDHNGSDP